MQVPKELDHRMFYRSNYILFASPLSVEFAQSYQNFGSFHPVFTTANGPSEDLTYPYALPDAGDPPFGMFTH
jgi:hypothetical protein